MGGCLARTECCFGSYTLVVALQFRLVVTIRRPHRCYRSLPCPLSHPLCTFGCPSRKSFPGCPIQHLWVHMSKKFPCAGRLSIFDVLPLVVLCFWFSVVFVFRLVPRARPPLVVRPPGPCVVSVPCRSVVVSFLLFPVFVFRPFFCCCCCAASLVVFTILCIYINIYLTFFCSPSSFSPLLSFSSFCLFYSSSLDLCKSLSSFFSFFVPLTH